MLHLSIDSTERVDSPRYLVCHPTPRDRWYTRLGRAPGGCRSGIRIAGPAKSMPTPHQWEVGRTGHSDPTSASLRVLPRRVYQRSRGVGWQTRYLGLSTRSGESIERCSISYWRVVTALIRRYIKKSWIFRVSDTFRTHQKIIAYMVMTHYSVGK